MVLSSVFIIFQGCQGAVRVADSDGLIILGQESKGVTSLNKRRR